MENEYSRTAKLLGEQGVEILRSSHVAVFGLGGVGGFAVEALARTGIGSFLLVDYDVVSESNLNRQIIATKDVISRKKTDVIKERIALINQKTVVKTVDGFFDENLEISFDGIDYIVDAIDSIPSKILLAKIAKEKNIPIISCLSTGNKLDASRFRVSDISKTHTCPIARRMRKELKDSGISTFTVVWSDEPPSKGMTEEKGIGSLCYVVGTAGFLLAEKVITDLLEKRGEK